MPNTRVKGLRRVLKDADAFLVNNLVNVRYLSGFTGSSAYVLVTLDEAYLVTDFRYAEQSEREVQGFKIIIDSKRSASSVAALCKKLKAKTLAFEDTASYGFAESLKEKGLKVVAMSNAVERLRIRKDEEELRLLQLAVKRAERALLEVKKYIKAGVTEQSFSLRLEERLRRNGMRKLPFDSIVASGPNSSLPHAKPTGRKFRPGDLVTIDWGAEADGYFSDMTRTFLLKGPDMTRKKQMYQLVAEAQKAGFEAVAAGAGMRAVDSLARDVIKKAGYGQYFGHGLGHGVGLEVHELPRLSPTGSGKLANGMVVTVEPGVYVPGLGGVRIEDMVVVEGGGCRKLTSLPRRLEILP